MKRIGFFPILRTGAATLVTIVLLAWPRAGTASTDPAKGEAEGSIEVEVSRLIDKHHRTEQRCESLPPGEPRKACYGALSRMDMTMNELASELEMMAGSEGKAWNEHHRKAEALLARALRQHQQAMQMQAE